MSYEKLSSLPTNVRKTYFNYVGSVEPIKKDGKFYAKLYLMDSDLNGNDWGVTPEGHKNMVASLKHAPLLGPPKEGESGNVQGGPEGTPHQGNFSDYGAFTDFITSGNMTFGLAEITDPYAQQKIESKEWDAVSPSVITFSELDKDGKSWVTDGIINHVLFCEKGAYPDAGVLETFGKSYQAALKQSSFTESSDLIGEKILGVAKRSTPEEKSLELHFNEGVLTVEDISFKPIIASRDIHTSGIHTHDDSVPVHGHNHKVGTGSSLSKGTQDPINENGGRKSTMSKEENKGTPPAAPATAPPSAPPPTGELKAGWPVAGTEGKGKESEPTKTDKTVEDLTKTVEDLKEELKSNSTWKKEQQDKSKSSKIAEIVAKQIEVGIVQADKKAEAIKELESFDEKTLNTLHIHAAKYVAKLKQAAAMDGTPAPPEVGLGTGASETGMTVGLWDNKEKKWVGGTEYNG